MASAAPRRGPPPFSVTDASRNGVRRLAISGELDMATAPALEARIELVEREAPQVLAVDLRDVTFIDVSGLRVLLGAARRARRAQRRFIIQNPGRIARQVFSLSSINHELEIGFDD